MPKGKKKKKKGRKKTDTHQSVTADADIAIRGDWALASLCDHYQRLLVDDSAKDESKKQRVNDLWLALYDSRLQDCSENQLDCLLVKMLDSAQALVTLFTLEREIKYRLSRRRYEAAGYLLGLIVSCANDNEREFLDALTQYADQAKQLSNQHGIRQMTPIVKIMRAFMLVISASIELEGLFTSSSRSAVFFEKVAHWLSPLSHKQRQPVSIVLHMMDLCARLYDHPLNFLEPHKIGVSDCESPSLAMPSLSPCQPVSHFQQWLEQCKNDIDDADTETTLAMALSEVTIWLAQGVDYVKYDLSLNSQLLNNVMTVLKYVIEQKKSSISQDHLKAFGIILLQASYQFIWLNEDDIQTDSHSTYMDEVVEFFAFFMGNIKEWHTYKENLKQFDTDGLFDGLFISLQWSFENKMHADRRKNGLVVAFCQHAKSVYDDRGNLLASGNDNFLKRYSHLCYEVLMLCLKLSRKYKRIIDFLIIGNIMPLVMADQRTRAAWLEQIMTTENQQAILNQCHQLPVDEQKKSAFLQMAYSFFLSLVEYQNMRIFDDDDSLKAKLSSTLGFLFSDPLYLEKMIDRCKEEKRNGDRGVYIAQIQYGLLLMTEYCPDIVRQQIDSKTDFMLIITDFISVTTAELEALCLPDQVYGRVSSIDDAIKLLFILDSGFRIIQFLNQFAEMKDEVVQFNQQRINCCKTLFRAAINFILEEALPGKKELIVFVGSYELFEQQYSKKHIAPLYLLLQSECRKKLDSISRILDAKERDQALENYHTRILVMVEMATHKGMFSMLQGIGLSLFDFTMPHLDETIWQGDNSHIDGLLLHHQRQSKIKLSPTELTRFVIAVSRLYKLALMANTRDIQTLNFATGVVEALFKMSAAGLSLYADMELQEAIDFGSKMMTVYLHQGFSGTLTMDFPFLFWPDHVNLYQINVAKQTQSVNPELLFTLKQRPSSDKTVPLNERFSVRVSVRLTKTYTSMLWALFHRLLQYPCDAESSEMMINLDEILQYRQGEHLNSINLLEAIHLLQASIHVFQPTGQAVLPTLSLTIADLQIKADLQPTSEDQINYNAMIEKNVNLILDFEQEDFSALKEAVECLCLLGVDEATITMILAKKQALNIQQLQHTTQTVLRHRDEKLSLHDMVSSLDALEQQAKKAARVYPFLQSTSYLRQSQQPQGAEQTKKRKPRKRKGRRRKDPDSTRTGGDNFDCLPHHLQLLCRHREQIDQLIALQLEDTCVETMDTFKLKLQSSLKTLGDCPRDDFLFLDWLVDRARQVVSALDKPVSTEQKESLLHLGVSITEDTLSPVDDVVSDLEAETVLLLTIEGLEVKVGLKGKVKEQQSGVQQIEEQVKLFLHLDTMTIDVLQRTVTCLRSHGVDEGSLNSIIDHKCASIIEQLEILAKSLFDPLTEKSFAGLTSQSEEDIKKTVASLDAVQHQARFTATIYCALKASVGQQPQQDVEAIDLQCLPNYLRFLCDHRQQINQLLSLNVDDAAAECLNQFKSTLSTSLDLFEAYSANDFPFFSQLRERAHYIRLRLGGDKDFSGVIDYELIRDLIVLGLDIKQGDLKPQHTFTIESYVLQYCSLVQWNLPGAFHYSSNHQDEHQQHVEERMQLLALLNTKISDQLEVEKSFTILVTDLLLMLRAPSPSAASLIDSSHRWGKKLAHFKTIYPGAQTEPLEEAWLHCAAEKEASVCLQRLYPYARWLDGLTQLLQGSSDGYPAVMNHWADLDDFQRNYLLPCSSLQFLFTILAYYVAQADGGIVVEHEGSDLIALYGNYCGLNTSGIMVRDCNIHISILNERLTDDALPKELLDRCNDIRKLLMLDEIKLRDIDMRYRNHRFVVVAPNGEKIEVLIKLAGNTTGLLRFPLEEYVLHLTPFGWKLNDMAVRSLLLESTRPLKEGLKKTMGQCFSLASDDEIRRLQRKLAAIDQTSPDVFAPGSSTAAGLFSRQNARQQCMSEISYVVSAQNDRLHSRPQDLAALLKRLASSLSIPEIATEVMASVEQRPHLRDCIYGFLKNVIDTASLSIFEQACLQKLKGKLDHNLEDLTNVVLICGHHFGIAPLATERVAEFQTWLESVGTGFVVGNAQSST